MFAPGRAIIVGANGGSQRTRQRCPSGRAWEPKPASERDKSLRNARKSGAKRPRHGALGESFGADCTYLWSTTPLTAIDVGPAHCGGTWFAYVLFRLFPALPPYPVWLSSGGLIVSTETVRRPAAYPLRPRSSSHHRAAGIGRPARMLKQSQYFALYFALFFPGSLNPSTHHRVSPVWIRRPARSARTSTGARSVQWTGPQGVSRRAAYGVGTRRRAGSASQLERVRWQARAPASRGTSNPAPRTRA